jgi:SAM-dependent methyltransferase
MGAPSFKDHFSVQAAEYERYRPGYPPALFDWVAAASPAHGRALDVGTGNGQAALGLAEFFDEVVAIDPSRAQIDRARPHPRVRYVVEPAERTHLPASSVDLVTAAQAAHWFASGPFFAEVRRVLRPGGLVVLWTYEKFRAGGRVDRLVDDFYRDVVGPYWPRERRHVEERYATLPLPFDELAAPAFELRSEWDADTALAYLGTWSAVQRYRRLRGRDPLGLLEPSLREAWGPGLRPLGWPIHLRAGRR